MKKSLVITLALVFVLGIVSTAFAAANPFVDVPAKHWAYESVAKLAKAGIVDGYGDGTFRGDKNMTRYEMAQIVAKAMANSEKADAALKAEIAKLQVEFASELNNLGVRVAALEKKVGTVKFTGDFRTRYNQTDYGTAGVGSAHDWNNRVRLYATADINDNWSAYARLENNSQSNYSSVNGDVENRFFYVTGKVADGVVATFGRIEEGTPYALSFDAARLQGLKVQFGNAVKTTVYYSKVNAGVSAISATMAANPQVTGIAMKYAWTKATNVAGSYMHVKDTTAAANTTSKFMEFGFDTKLNDDWTLTGVYGKGSKTGITANTSAWYGRVAYKTANKAVVGSYSLYATYLKIGANSVWDSQFDPDNYNAANANGLKGYQLGWAYVPQKNVVFSGYYLDGKASTAGVVTPADKFLRAQVEFFF